MPQRSSCPAAGEVQARQGRAPRRSAAGLALLLGLSCGCASEPGPLRRFLSRPEWRRELLLAALEGDNGYAALRRARYGREWLALPRFLPATAPFRFAGQPAAQAQALSLPGADEADPEEARLQAALRALGAAAFVGYPAQLWLGVERVLTDEATAQRYGLWSDARGEPHIGGLLFVEQSGQRALASSCATCHARPGQPGAANLGLRLGDLLLDSAAAPADLPAARWGPGRVDTSPDGRDNPALIPDLRVLAQQRHLHHGATLRAGGALPLALRIETLLITSFSEGVAPPPEIALGLALYLLDLGSPPPSVSPPPVFVERCAGCHAPPSFAGEPVALAEVGTDPALGQSPERGTGRYRTPTLRGVSQRGALLHDGSLPDVGALLDPARLLPGYTGGRLGPGPVPGHRYGLDLPPAERSALLAFVESL